ncbi:MAG: glycosyltransferase, partial [Candidatus Sericytochromatia bacterium]
AAHLAASPSAEAARRRAAERGPRAGLPAPWGAVLALPEPRRISLCMIVKNEAAMLPRLLGSIEGLVDEIVVVDTGSRDETAEIARAAGARVHHWAWTDDFAAARNESLRHATGEWILMLDSDSEVDIYCRRGLRRFLQRPPIEGDSPVAYLAQIADHLTGQRDRIDARAHLLAVFPNDPDLRFEGALHEQLTDRRLPPRPIAFRPLNDFLVHHYGYAEATMAHQGKRERNLRILRRELAERADDPFVRYNMALQLRLEDALDAAVDHARACLALGAARGPAYRPAYWESAHILLADLLIRRSAHTDAAAACEAGLSAYPRSPDLLGMLGLCRLVMGRPEHAIAPLEAALAQAGAIGTGMSQTQYQGWLSELMLALAHWRLGDQARCDEHLTRMWAIADDRQETLERLLRFSVVLTGGPEAGVALMAGIGVTVRLA